MEKEPAYKELKKRVKELEKEIAGQKKEELNYKAIFENSPEVIVFIDKKGNVIDINEKVNDSLGYKPEEIIGKNFLELEFMNEDTIRLISKKYAQRLRGEKILPYSLDVFSKDGDKKRGQVVANIIKDEKGKVAGALMLISDITGQYEQAQIYHDLSERKQALFQAIPDLIFVIKRDGTYVDFKADQDGELISPRDKIIGENIHNTGFSEECMKLIDDNMKEAFLTGNVLTFEYEAKTRGGLKTFECRMIKLNEEEVLSVIRNITRHKQLDKELRLKNTVFETSVAANSIADINGNLTYVNQSFLNIWGYHKKTEVIGRPISDFFLKAEEAGRVLQGLNNIGVWRGEFAGKKKDGSSFIVQGFATIVVDSSGEIAGYQATNIDITENKRSEEVLRKNEQRYKALFENNIDSVFIFDINGILLEANSMAHEMLGCGPGEIVGKHISEFTSSREADDSRGKIRSLLKGEVLPVYVRTFVKKDGTEFPGDVNISLIYDSEGSPDHFQSIVRDMTYRKQSASDID